MILDTGIYHALADVDQAEPGGAPDIVHEVSFEGWYGELSFETAPARPTEDRQEVRTDLRIRVLQNRHLTNRCRILCEHGYTNLGDSAMSDDDLRELIGAGMVLYEITRAYHGTDPESGQPITDLSLMEVSP